MIDVSAYLGHFAFRQIRHNTGAGLVRFMDRFGIDRAVVGSAAAEVANPHNIEATVNAVKQPR